MNSLFGHVPDIIPVHTTGGKTGDSYMMGMSPWPDRNWAFLFPDIEAIGEQKTPPIVGHKTKYGLEAFVAPTLLEAESLNYGFSVRVFHARRLKDDGFRGFQFPKTHQHLQDTMMDLQKRRQVWAQLRPWYKREYRRWQLTPYSMDIRSMCATFKELTKVKHRVKADDALRQENLASNILSDLAYLLIEDPKAPRKGSPWPVSVWFTRFLVHIMQAVLPERVTPVVREAQGESLVPGPWAPSKEVYRENTPWRLAPLLLQNREGPIQLQARSVHFPCIDEEGKKRPLRLWLHQRAVQIWEEHSSCFPLPEALSRAVAIELKALLRQANTVPPDWWLNFRLGFPTYDPNLVTRDGEDTYIPYEGTLTQEDYHCSPTDSEPDEASKMDLGSESESDTVMKDAAVEVSDEKEESEPDVASKNDLGSESENDTVMKDTVVEISDEREESEDVKVPDEDIESLYEYVETTDEDDEYVDEGVKTPNEDVKTPNEDVERRDEDIKRPDEDMTDVDPEDEDAEMTDYDTHVGARAARVSQRPARATAGARQPTRYISVSELGENASEDRNDTNWGVWNNERGMKVYDVTDILRKDPTLKLDDVFQKTELGHEIMSDHVLGLLLHQK
ncbi:hypothetical protein B0T22DRAFT_128088 [Podospora appendiculata]|uniref:Uncharacterized protein n=1 Tax=Podospora appendiculata TaxID=314037 RepID=A0AAE0X7S8_9PEZI|nr:hypothetical protein B0T22DRAFT_128088 [Podospora appendiculata]